jgi:hypothetical protein
VLAPAAIDDHVVFVEASRHQARILDVSGKQSAKPLTADLPFQPRQAVRRKNAESSELLVLCAGRVDDGEHEAEPAALAVIDSGGVDRVYTLQSRFTSMIQSDDGNRVFLFFDDSASGDVDSLLFSPNEVEIIDLTLPPGDGNPTLKTLRGLGSRPQSVVFSPTLDIDGEERHLAVVLFDSQIGILDLDHLERPEITIPLRSPTAGALGLAQVLFNSDEAKAYLRGTTSNDFYVVGLASGGSGENDFVPSLNLLGAGVPPSDMALYRQPVSTESGTELETRLFAVAGSTRQALVVDANSSQVTVVNLDVQADQILLFENAKFDDDVVATRALLHKNGSQNVTFVDLVDLEERGHRNVEVLQLDRPYGRVIKLDDDLVLLIHEGGGLSLLDLRQRTAQPIQSQANLVGAIQAEDKLWLAPLGESRVGFLDLASFHPNEVRLDASIESFVFVPSDTRSHLVVSHPSPVGYVTVLDAENPAALDRAVSLRGFLLDGILEGGR